MKYLFTILSILLTMPVLTQAQIYVDKNANGTNTGESWANAFTELSDVISSAPGSEQIWVAAGTYYPSSSGDVTVSFELNGSAQIYGGFDGTETSLDQRNINANPTILSGDYNNNDAVTVVTDPLSLTYTNFGDNANRILIGSGISGSVFLDGFTFTGGNCDTGGAAVLFSASGTLNVHISNCQFIDNRASSSAAALRFGCGTGNTLNTTVEKSEFIRNEIYGGGASKGGCVWSTGNGFIVSDYINCNFKNNFSAGRGGAICTDMDVVSSYINCLFNENRASSGGAIFENSTQDGNVANCTFYNNSAWNEASVIYNLGNGDMYTYNSIFNENDLLPLYGGTFLIGNCILDASSFSTISSQAPGSQDLGDNQFDLDPSFKDITIDDFSLATNSIAIDAGDNAAVLVNTDITGYINRIVDGAVDLGVYESHIPMVASVANAVICFDADFGSAEITASEYPDFTYQWSDSNVNGATPDNLMAGSNQVTVTNSIGDFVVLEVTLTENTEITATTSSTASTGADGTATANPDGGVTPYTFLWNTLPVQTTATATDLPAGDYQLTIMDSLGCEVIVDVTVAQSTAVHSVDNTDGIQIGPNPFSNKIQINFSDDFLQVYPLTNITIYNSTGQLVFQSKLNGHTNEQLDLANLAVGFYVIELISPNARFQKRLIRQ